MAADKPLARQLGIRILSVHHPYQDRFMALRRDDLVWPDGTTGSYAVVELNPVVIVVPVTTDGQVVLIRQYRYTVDDWVWEVPAGGSHDFEGDDLTDLVRRELREEIGGEAKEVTHLGVYHPAVGKLNVDVHLYLATGVTLGETRPESGEMIEVHTVSVERALTMARDGTMSSSTSAYALLRCEPQLRGLSTEH